MRPKVAVHQAIPVPTRRYLTCCDPPPRIRIRPRSRRGGHDAFLAGSVQSLCPGLDVCLDGGRTRRLLWSILPGTRDGSPSSPPVRECCQSLQAVPPAIVAAVVPGQVEGTMGAWLDATIITLIAATMMRSFAFWKPDRRKRGPLRNWSCKTGCARTRRPLSRHRSQPLPGAGELTRSDLRAPPCARAGAPACSRRQSAARHLPTSISIREPVSFHAL